MSSNLLTVDNKANLLTVFRGEKGDPGDTPFGLPSLPVAQNISALRILSNINGLYDYSDPNDINSVWSIVGFSNNSVSEGSICSPIINQPVTDQSWNWVRGSPVFLNINGTLSQNVPSTNFLIVVARVLDSKTLFINIEEPIAL